MKKNKWLGFECISKQTIYGYRSWFLHGARLLNHKYPDHNFVHPEYRPQVYHHCPIAFKNEKGYGATLPGNGKLEGFASEELAIKAVEKVMIDRHWVKHIAIAKKRAQKEADLRNAGLWYSRGPAFKKSDYDRCLSEILSITIMDV